MTWMRNKKHLSLVISLLVTAFVTACVKNGAKNEPAPVVKDLSLDSETLSNEEINGEVPVRIKETMATPVERITKEYRFNLEKISNFEILRRSAFNEECVSESGFDFSFALYDPDGEPIELDSKKRDRVLVPGRYRLKVALINGGLCKKINFRFTLETKTRKDLMITDDLDISYQCETVEEVRGAKRRRLRTNNYINVHSSPMQVNRFNRFNGKMSVILGDNRICEKELRASTRCSSRNVPAPIKEGPRVAKNVICHSKGDKRKKGHAYLQMNRKDGEKTVSFNCVSHSEPMALELSDCYTMTNFRKALDIDLREVEIIFSRGKVDIEYDIDEEVADDTFTSSAYVMIYYKDEDGRDKALLDRYIPKGRGELMRGSFRLNQPGLLRRLRNRSVNDLKIVFSRQTFNVNHPEGRKMGFSHINLGKVCQANQNGILKKVRGDSEKLCQ